MKVTELIQENSELKHKLSIAQKWMKREIESDSLEIQRKKEENKSEKKLRKFHENNIEEILSNKVKDFLGEDIYMITPQYVLDNIVWAEVLFYNLYHYKFTDWLGVVASYNKAVDYIIESFITKSYRKFAKQTWQTELKINDPLEKTLNLVVNNWYILWVWKLYHILSLIKSNSQLYDYTETFKKFLLKDKYIWNTLLDDNFFKSLKQLVDSDLFWEKRHIWKVTFEEARFARKILIWDLKNQDCIIYMLLKIWEI